MDVAHGCRSGDLAHDEEIWQRCLKYVTNFGSETTLYLTAHRALQAMLNADLDFIVR